MLFPRDEAITRECPKGTKCVVISERISAGLPFTGTSLSGTVRLERRIDDVVGFRVCFFGLSRPNAVPLTDGTLMILQSTRLGACAQRSPFMVAVSLDDDSLSGINFSDVIGLNSFGTNNDYNFPIEVNRKIYFPQAMSVQDFDWTISAVNANFNVAAAFAAEIVIQFFTLCKCPK